MFTVFEGIYAADYNIFTLNRAICIWLMETVKKRCAATSQRRQAIQRAFMLQFEFTKF